MKHLTNGEKGVEKAHFLDQNVGETNLISSVHTEESKHDDETFMVVSD